MYGLAARAVRISSDGLTYRFLMRPEAKFHDGSRMTAHDVAFSLNLLKEKGHPIIVQLMRDVSGAEATDDATVVVRFAAGPRPRRAAVRGVAADLLARLLFEAQVRRDHARGSARLRSLQGRQARGRPLHRIRPRQGLVGRRPAGVGRAQQFRRRSATSSIAIATWRSKASPAATICSARNSPRASGRRATISRRSRTAASSRTCFPTTRRPARRAGSSTPAARSSRTGCCAKR